MSENSSIRQQVSRVTRSKREAQAAYDRISRWYDLLEGAWEEKPRKAGLKKLAVQEGEIALEVGAGPGHSLKNIARTVGALGKAYDLDLSPRMLALTRSRLRAAGLLERAVLHCGDAVRMPYEAAFFDAIFISFVLELFDTPEIPEVLAESRRVLRTGGRLCVVSLSKASGLDWMRRWYEWGHRRFPKFLDCRPIFVRKVVEDAGFATDEVVRTSLWGLGIEIVLARKTR